MGAEKGLQECLEFYKALGQAERFAGVTQSLLLILEKLMQFAGGSVKRCKDKNLDDALQLLLGVNQGFAELEHEHVLPLMRCVLACQMETTNSSGSFHRLEKMVVVLSEGRESLVSQLVNDLMSNLVEDKEGLSPHDLQTVSMFLEESTLGQCYWRNNLMPLLRCVAATFNWMQQDQGDRNKEGQYVVVKVCLQLFKLMPKEISLLVWSERDESQILQSILGSLLQVVLEKTVCKDTRLLAGTALSMLVNTAPDSQSGATAVLGLYHLLSPPAGTVIQTEGTRGDDPKGECQFGMLRVPLCAGSPNGLERLVLTRGLLVCCKKGILTCQIDGSLNQACLLLDVLFPTISVLLEEQKDCQYYCFQVFSLWLQCLRGSLDEIWKITENRVLADDSSLLRRLTQFLWNSAESLVEGVSDFVHRSFQHLLEMYSLECDRFEESERPLYGQFLQRVLLMPWQSRARYFPLSAILPYLGPAKVLDAYENLPQHLLSCLSTNHLSPVASDLYKDLLQLQRKVWTEGRDDASEEDLAKKWATAWLPTLSKALTSPVPFLQSNASNYLLGWTLRIFPATYYLLAQSFGAKNSAELCAWVTLLSVQKTITGVLPADAETLKRLSSCLFSKEENVRLAALNLLCSGPRTNQALSPTEMRLLKEFLALNLNCDSSSFRQLLQASVKKALVRLRDSSLASLRRQGPEKEESLAGGDPQTPLEQAVWFVEWLLRLCTLSLTAGSNYQRKKSALLLLAAILETCTDTWSPQRKKGQPPCNMAALLTWARRKGYWNFFSQNNMLLLLSCLQDATNEIRELASELLVRYFPPTFPESVVVALFACAQEAMCSPRVQEVEAGAVLMKTILQKSDDCTLKHILAEDILMAPCRCLRFLEYLLGVLRDHSASAHRDLLQAARTTPIHGVLTALRRCLLEIPEVADSMRKVQLRQQWRLFLSRLVISAREISALLLGVLQSKQTSPSNQQAAAPSFAEMGTAIGCLIRLGKGLEGHDSEDLVLLSEEHSLILTCCWVSVKEIGLLLGGLIERILPLVPPASGEPLLPLQVVQMASEVFQEILLTCRHWGAVEGCSMGFTKFCTALLSHPDLDLQDIPRTMLDQGLELLSSPRNSSITRRAAGFPMLFLCIVAGEDPAKSHPLLAHCIQTLLALASAPIRQDWDQTLDLPQVSAVHVLQTLVRGSGLGTAMYPYVTSVMTLSLKALGSPSWAMRNAAIQLLSALTVRLLGQKQSRDEGCGQDQVSPEALFSHYPQLKSVLLEELTLAAQVSGDPQKGRFHLCPSLYAILSFLAKLQPSTDSMSSLPLGFVESLFQLAGNPIYAVRVMAAKALVPLVPATEYGNILLRLVSDLPQSRNVVSHNALHGGLLQIQSVLAQAVSMNSLPPDLLLSITRQLEDRLWLLTPKQRCPLVRLVYLQVVSLLVGSCPPRFAQQVSDILESSTGSQDGVARTVRDVQSMLGSAPFRQFSVRFLCSEAARQASPEKVGKLCSLLQRGTAEEQVALLTWMMENEGSEDSHLSKILQETLLEKLSKVLKGRTDDELPKIYLEAFVHLYGHPMPIVHKLMGPVRTECMEILLSMVESNGVSPACFRHALCSVALLLSPGFEDEPSLARWCAAVERCSRPLSAEVCRMAAATSLKLAGPSLVWRAQELPSTSLQVAAVRSIDVAIGLLQDEERKVREEASIFASLASQQQRTSGPQPQSPCNLLQSNKGLLDLLQLLLETFWCCPDTFASLMRRLPAMDLGSALRELEDKGAVSLYKEDEPNVYAEPAVLSRTLLPFLLHLLSRARPSPKLWGKIQSWLDTSGPGVWSNLQHCLNWWSRGNSTCLLLKAIGCPKVDAAVNSLLVQALLVVHALEILEEEKQPRISQIHFSSQDLRGLVLSVQELLAQHGISTAHEPFRNIFQQGLSPAVSPALQRLVNRTASKYTDKALQASYTPFPAHLGTPGYKTPAGGPQTPSTNTPSPRTAFQTPVTQDPASTTDNLLRLPKRWKVSDFF